jgi:phosphoserine phosphatase
LNISWKEEVEEILVDQKRGYLSDDEAKERIEELYHLIPEDALEEIYEKIENIAFELEEEQWTDYLNEQYDLIDDDDPDKEWIS